ncbi:MAG: Hydroxypyruvate reductase [Edaphobacter sp.]|nr:Hydroxypyruvate reductase [Edaphobacter sp.]
MTLLKTAKGIFLDTLHHLRIEEAIRTRVHYQGESLHVGEVAYDLQDFDRVVVISIGKAAAPMWDALRPALEPVLQRGQAIEAIVVGATIPNERDPRVRFFPGSHPLPNQTSFVAAEAVLKLLASCDDRCLVFFLISGGASAMIEKALDGSVTVEETVQFYRSLVHSGLAITQMNALRKHFSQVKGGRLAITAQTATQCTLLISDVPESALHVVGSGPSLPDPSTKEDCRRIIDANLSALNFSEKLVAFFRNPELEETAKADNTAFDKASWLSLLSSDDLCRMAGENAARLGFHVVVDNHCDDWDYRDAAVYLLDRLEELRQLYPRVCLLSAGEVSVRLSSAHGVGGRNQQFVLECSRLIDERKLKATILSGGSDGVDGNSPAAGAVCDETTVARAASKGLDIIAALEQFDSFPMLHALDDAIITGPTGNNVRDLRVLLSSS